MFELPPPDDDGLYTPEVKSHSVDKHHYLRRYTHAFIEAMKNKPWEGLHYVDLFAGAGIERIKDDGLDWGSPLIAAQMPNKFSRLHLCEKNLRKFNALEMRISRFAQPSLAQLIRGDANQAIDEIVSEIPPRTLSLAFLDPYGLHLHFATLKKLSACRSDLIIYFPDHLDALRNWENVYMGEHDSNLDLVLDTDRWLVELQANSKTKWAQILSDIYISQIETLGYNHFGIERIRSSAGQPLYKLIFCSKAKIAVDIWRKVSLKKPDGQWTFDFGSD